MKARLLSTGDPSTLGTYKKLASVFGKKAVNFIQEKIDESPNGEDEVVIADESQMIYLLTCLAEPEPEPETLTCIENKGMEYFFDIGVEYYLVDEYPEDEKDMFLVENKEGDNVLVLKERFTRKNRGENEF